MNKVILMGRLVRDPEVTYAKSNQNNAIARYTLAVDRRFAKKDDANQQTADFIPCVVFGKGAEFAQKYLKKGTKIAVEGRLYQSSWQDPDTKKNRSSINVVIDSQEFAESKGGGGSRDEGSDSVMDGFANIPDSIDDEDLPFN